MKLARKILKFSRRFTEQDEFSKILNDLGLKEKLMIFDVVRYSPSYGIGFYNALFLNRSEFS